MEKQRDNHPGAIAPPSSSALDVPASSSRIDSLLAEEAHVVGLAGGVHLAAADGDQQAACFAGVRDVPLLVEGVDLRAAQQVDSPARCPVCFVEPLTLAFNRWAAY